MVLAVVVVEVVVASSVAGEAVIVVVCTYYVFDMQSQSRIRLGNPRNKNQNAIDNRDCWKVNNSGYQNEPHFQ